MKLLDKFKDLFMDDVIEEEEIEVEEKETDKVYQEPKSVLPKVMREDISSEEVEKLPKLNLNAIKEQPALENKEIPKKKEIDLKDFDFSFELNDNKRNVNISNIGSVSPNNSSIPSRREKNITNNDLEMFRKEKEVSTPKKSVDLYPAKEESWVKPKFKASPVISPVYGVLDKNYKKEEVKEKKEDKKDMKRASKKVDFETVRKKAFGNLSDDIKDNLCENCELYKEALKNSMLDEDNLLYDMTVEDNKDVTIEKAYDNYEEFGVLYEPKKVEVVEDTNNSDVDNEFHSMNDVIHQIDEVEEDNNHEDIPSREEIKAKKNEEVKVDDDFFELIDSMYKERSDS